MPEGCAEAEDRTKCRKDALKRKIGRGAAVIFKGPGFYCNDYHAATHDVPKAEAK